MDPSDMRTVFISDLHLGSRGAQSERLLAFLNRIQPDHLYLVGDILDFWRLRSGWYWPRTNNRIVRRVLDLAAAGTRVRFVPGNHDELLRDYTGAEWAGITVEREAIHDCADGKRLLVLHGDEFDAVVLHSRWVALLGARAYELLLVLNRWFNYLRRRSGLGYWSLSTFLKHKVKNATRFISDFEQAVARDAGKRGVDGVVCGHIHKPELTTITGLVYANCGDWVESCSALVEDRAGELTLLDGGRFPDSWIEVPRAVTEDLCA